ncbi:MAG: xanthine dehydrogenase family protein molybdopterin-binding subunit [Armatimonadota bacterium]|nr:xanthine dehydrogenase family protein molybdopterin-binding subunit [Armatimonadota bacterium]MDR7421224.1 xanthine dehydrogenase family protein molybdopterin-binding subunit [Armatimonadota bacterium]MDR7452989.1 xanthine dehydrogenase family protein molybdopterin-binding subunit [Armatimonadota bacterium]MDR7457547.1 xanthine dehydrogenase family protein molybdopterin-binding subunit [Armatimonadota bacterium]
MAVIGKSARRIEGLEKITGAARYTEDLRLPGMLHARLLLSPHPRARVAAVGAEAARAVPGVAAVVTAAELARLGAGARGLLAGAITRYAGEPVAVVLAATEQAAADGLEALRGASRFEALPAVMTIDEAMRPDAPLVRESTEVEEGDAQAHATVAVQTQRAERPSNIANRVTFSRGNAGEALAQARVVVRRTYATSRIHQGYLEPHATVATTDPGTGELTIYTATQGTFYVRNEVASALGLSQQQVRVVPMTVGGGFGGKILLFQPLAGALTRLVGRPVRLVLTRADDFAATEPGPASRIELELGAEASGALLTLRARIIFDAGCEPGAPLSIASLMLGGYYKFPNLEIEAVEVLTNKPKTGAYRAPGVPQATFAIESAMSELAGLLGEDPIAYRLRFAAAPGDPQPHGRPWPKMGLRQVLEALDRHPLRRRPKGPDEGIGVAIGGWPGGLESASACVRANTDGTFQVVMGAVDITGTATTMALIAAEVLGVPPERVRVITADTHQAPYAGMSGGSKITYTVGSAVRLAAEDARRQILAIAASHLEARTEDLEIVEGTVRVKGSPTVTLPVAEIAAMSMRFGAKYPPVFGQGNTVITRQSPGFAGHLVRVRVDRETGAVHLLEYAIAQDVGFAINPAAVQGQMLGGVAQGIGWGLFERMAYDESGSLLTATLSDYALPRAPHVPRVDTIMVEVPSDDGPFGAKGVGEPPVIPAAAAIANAVADAVGARVTDLPITPERVLAALGAAAD